MLKVIKRGRQRVTVRRARLSLLREPIRGGVAADARCSDAPMFGMGAGEFGWGGIYGHVFVGRDESITSYTFPGRDSWQQ